MFRELADLIPIEKLMKVAPRSITRDKILEERLRSIFEAILTESSITMRLDFLELPIFAMLDKAQRFIETITAKGERAYIGITDNPFQRWHLHKTSPNAPTPLRSMHVIAITLLSSETAYLEKELIARTQPLNLNVAPGGESASLKLISFLYLGLTCDIAIAKGKRKSPIDSSDR